MAPVTIDLCEYATDAAAQAAYKPTDFTVTHTAAAMSSLATVAYKHSQRMVIAAAGLSTSGAYVRVKLRGHATSSVTLGGCSIGQRSGTTGNFASAPTRLTFNGGQNTGLIPASGYIYSDWVQFSLNETADHLCHLSFTNDATNNVIYGSGSRYYKDSYDTDDTLTEDISALSYTTSSHNVSLSSIEVCSPAVIPYSEGTIKEEGSYSLKGVASTGALNKSIQKSIAVESFYYDLPHTIDTTYVKGSGRAVIPAANITTSGSFIRIVLKANPAHDFVMSAVSIGERSGTTASFTGTPTRVTFGGATEFTLTAGALIYSDWIEFSLDEAKSYLVAFAYISDSNTRHYDSRATNIGVGWYSLATTSDDTMTVDGSGYTNDGNYTIFICGIDVISDPIDLSGINRVPMQIRSSRTGSNVKVGIVNTNGTTAEVTPNIASADTWQTGTIDLSGVADANKNAIYSTIITVTNADSANTFYLDNIIGDNSYSLSLSTASGSFTLSGAVVNLRYFNLAAASGSLALSGTAVAFNKGRTFAIESGTAAITGTDVSLLKTNKLACSTGSFALSGTAVDLRNFKLAATTGAIELTGTAVALDRIRLLKAASGAIAINGTAADLRHFKLAATSGSIGLSGTSAGLYCDRQLDVESGTAALTGTVINPYFGHRLTAESGSASLSGTATSLEVGRVMKATTGAVTLAGHWGILYARRKMAAAKGGLTLGGSAVGIKRTALIAASSKEFTITGKDTSLRKGFYMSSPSGSYSLAGQDVAVKATRTFALSSRAFALTGKAVGIYHSYTMAAPGTSFTSTGTAVALGATRKIRLEQGPFTAYGTDIILTPTISPGSLYAEIVQNLVAAELQQNYICATMEKTSVVVELQRTDNIYTTLTQNTIAAEAQFSKQ